MAAIDAAEMLSKAATAGDQSSRMETLWTLDSRPRSVEEDEQALMASLSYSTLQYGGQQLQLAITNSDAWTPADLAQLESLVQSRNRFVCMQLVTMVKVGGNILQPLIKLSGQRCSRFNRSHSSPVFRSSGAANLIKCATCSSRPQPLDTLMAMNSAYNVLMSRAFMQEQYDKVKAAQAAEDAAILHSARFMFLATITQADTNNVVAAGLFYPRSCSKDQVEMPHMYVELLCCNSPGKGYGTVLLQHIEQFTAGCCDFISARFFGSLAPSDARIIELSSSLDCNSVPASVTAGQLGGSSGIVLPLVAMDAAVPAGGYAAACCSACSRNSCSMDVSGAYVSSNCGLHPLTATAAAAAPAGVPATAVPGQQVRGESPLCHPPTEPIDIPHAAAPASPIYDATIVIISCSNSSSLDSKRSSSCPLKKLQGIKLLSVGSAQSFYERNGYGAPDVCKEMFKPLMCCSKKGGLGDGCSVADSSCSSIAMSIC